MKSFKVFCEMAAPNDAVKKHVYYHGTSAQNIDSYIKNGITPPDLSKRKGLLKPVEGRVYITKSLKYAIIYTIGANILGLDITDRIKSGKEKQYGYLFVIDSSELTEVQPDEDEVGHLLYDKKAPYWLQALADKHLSPNTMDKVMDGEYQYFAKVGKVLLKRMSDKQKLEILNMNVIDNLAHGGRLNFKEVWKFDKYKNKDLNPDGSNFFKLAEKL